MNEGWLSPSWWCLCHGDLFSTGVFELDVLDAHETQLLHRCLTLGCALEAECLDGSGHLRTGVHATHVGGLVEVATCVTVRCTIHGGDAATRHREEAEEQLSEWRATVSVQPDSRRWLILLKHIDDALLQVGSEVHTPCQDGACGQVLQLQLVIAHITACQLLQSSTSAWRPIVLNGVGDDEHHGCLCIG